MAEDTRYTLTMYVAAPGTPLNENTKDGWRDTGGAPSLSGHMYYAISDGSRIDSYGFEPRKAGSAIGPGHVVKDDIYEYEKPFYARTMEVNQAQYLKLREFGEESVRQSNRLFDLGYNLPNNNTCVDFTWSALRHAGIYRADIGVPNPFGDPLKLKNFEGSVKPMDNIDDIRAIKPPIPGSDLNTENRNPLPPQRWFHKPLSAEDLQHPDHPLHKDHTHIQSGVAAMDAAANKPRDAQSANMEMSLLHLAVKNDLRADWAMLGIATEHVRAGQNVFVGQGEPTAQPRRWAHMDTHTAVHTPAEDSLQRIAALQAERAQTASHAQSQSLDAVAQTEPARAPRVG